MKKLVVETLRGERGFRMPKDEALQLIKEFEEGSDPSFWVKNVNFKRSFIKSVRLENW